MSGESLCYSTALQEARGVRVMQLMRQELFVRKKRFEKLPLFDCVAGELLAVGRVPGQRAEFLCVRASLDTRCSILTAFEHRKRTVAPTSAQPSLCSGIAQKHLLRRCVANEWTRLPLAIHSPPSTPSLVLEGREFLLSARLKMWKSFMLCSSYHLEQEKAIASTSFTTSFLT